MRRFLLLAWVAVFFSANVLYAQNSSQDATAKISNKRIETNNKSVPPGRTNTLTQTPIKPFDEATVPPVGEPYDVRFELPAGKALQSGIINLPDVQSLVMKWDPPLYSPTPQDVFTYIISRDVNGHRVDYPPQKETSLIPFVKGAGTFDIGTNVFSIYASVEGAGNSNVVESTITIFYQITPPVPTPVPADPDINRDDQVNFLDVLLFALSYKTYDGQTFSDNKNYYNPDIDFIYDKDKNVIDVKDLVVFCSLYANKAKQANNTPVWLYVDAPIITIKQDGSASSCDPKSKEQVKFPPNEINLKRQFIFCYIYYATFYFSPVPGAKDYVITYTSDKVPAENPMTVKTNNQTFICRGFTNFTNWASIQVQAQMADNSLSPKSAPIILTAID